MDAVAGLRRAALAVGVALAAAPLARAGDVLVPEATPAQLSDFSVSYLFYDTVLGHLRELGMAVQDAETMRPWAGSDADACYDNPDCPTLIWDHDAGGTLLIVLGIGQTDDGVAVNTRIYREGESQPAENLHEVVPSGGEDRYASKLAGIASRLNGRSRAVAPADDVPETRPASSTKTSASSSASSAKTASTTSSSAKTGSTTSSSAKTSASSSSAKTSASSSSAKTSSAASSAKTSSSRAPDVPRDSAADEKARMAIPPWSYANFRESGLSRADWLRQKRVHTGHVTLEVYGGMALGDIDRGYGVRVNVENTSAGFDTVAASTWTGPGPGKGFTGSVALTYTPVWFLETSLQGGLLNGRKYLNVGWECVDCEQTSDAKDYDPVNGVEGFLEPRARFLPIAAGYVKPYVLAGFHLRLWDGFEVPDGSSVDYPNVPGGAGFGITAGAGVSIDVLPALSIVLEAPYTYTLSRGQAEVNSAQVDAIPGRLDPSHGVLRLSGGVGIHF